MVLAMGDAGARWGRLASLDLSVRVRAHSTCPSEVYEAVNLFIRGDDICLWFSFFVECEQYWAMSSIAQSSKMTHSLSQSCYIDTSSTEPQFKYVAHYSCGVLRFICSQFYLCTNRKPSHRGYHIHMEGLEACGGRCQWLWCLKPFWIG